MSEASVSAGYTKSLLDFAVAKGADATMLLSSAGIDAEALEDQDNRLPFSRHVALMRAGPPFRFRMQLVPAISRR